MPSLGMGTYGIKDTDVLKKAVMKQGYLMTSCFYNNEEIVGQAIKEVIKLEKLLKRDEVYIISKVQWGEPEAVEAACRRSL